MRLIVLAVLLIACGGPATPTPSLPTAPPSASSPAAPPRPARATFPGVPATPAGDQLAWVLDAIVARHGKLDRAELEARFHPSFLAQVPVDLALQFFEQLGE